MSTERQFFGTDGVRGPYGGPVVNEAFFARLACAAGRWALAQPRSEGKQRAESSTSGAEAKARQRRVLVGRDTRVSGEPLARAAIAGLRVAGLEPFDLGVLPTPAIALAVRDGGAALGVVITASHNPAGDNGIKFFKRDGLKLSDEEETALEALLPDEAGREKALAQAWEAETPRDWSLYRAENDDATRENYVAMMVRLLPIGALRGWHLVLDAANGATVTTSPRVLLKHEMVIRKLGHHCYSPLLNRIVAEKYRSLQEFASLPPEQQKARLAEIEKFQFEEQINAGCGSEHPEKMCAAVREHGARLGIAHDGDGDRCVLCDEQGEVLDGDEILTILALHALREGRLGVDTLVVTVQSNLGVDAAVAAAGGRVVRTPVGDRHVAEKMRELGATLGGESSGHIICADVSPTGDGLVAALRVMEVMRATGRPLSELRRWLRKFPQASTTVTVATGAAKPSLDTLPTLTTAIRALETEMGARGRVLARWSGTEPKLRLLVEGPDDIVVRDGLARLAAAARTDLGAGAA
jgi:phosphoglucosamine mutase